MSRDSFIFYKSFWDAIKELPRDVQGEVLTVIIEYGLSGETNERLKPIAKAMFTLIKPQLDANYTRYESGKKGGRPKKTEAKKKPNDNQTITKPKPNKNDNVNVNVNYNENELSSESKKNARALDFLKDNFPSRFETEFLMRFDSKIENIEKFKMDFNDTVDQEDLEYTPKRLFARLGKYARNWVDNQHKYQNNGKSDSEPKIGRQTLSDIDANSRGW